jgi:hypothetical protein
MGRVVFAVCVLACLVPLGATAAPNPRIVVADPVPLTLVGRGFPPSQHVAVIVRAPGVAERRTVRADSLGRFRIEIGRISLTGRLRCGFGVVIMARVKDGDLVLWSQRLPDCPAPLRPPGASTP